LPFENESPEPGSEYFADGMTEELIGAFRRAAGLRVPPRSSVFALKGLKVPGREKGRRLNVDVVLEGTVFRSASLVRLYAELVDVAADTTIWSETLENQVGDPLIIQNKLASEIMARLGPRLRIAGSGNLMRQGTRDPKAYDLYLQGRYAMGPRTHDGLMHAIELFKQAVARDSSYALAYSGLADAYGLVAGYSGALSPAEGFERGRDAANRALSLDSTSAAAHTSVAFMSLFYLYKWADAERDLSAAVASDSAYTFAHVIRGWMFSITGRSTLGIRELERARQLEPLSPLVNTRLGSLLYYAGDTDGAVRQLRSTLATDSTYTLAHAELAHVLAAQGKVDEALAELAKAPDFTYRYEAAPVIYAVARAGRAAEARRMLASRLGQMDRTHIDAAGTALVYVGLGDTTEAFRWLDRAMQDRPWSLSLLRIEPLWRPIASDPRFVAHLKQLQLATGS
jgi:TolB-like protein/Tfp pilus assembly protein PilF